MAANEKKERIVLDVAYQPQVRTNTDTRRLMLDVIIALIPAVVVAVWQYGLHPLLVIASSVISAVFFEWLYRKLMKKTCSIGDLSAVVTGLLLALTLPTGTPWWIPIIGSFFAIVVVKQLYGGIGKNFLNPALAGRAFLLSSYTISMTASWQLPKALAALVPDAVTSATVPAFLQNAVMHPELISSATPLSYLKAGAALPEYYNIQSLLFGVIPGCIGELSAVALLIGGLYLIIRKVISWRIPVSFIGTVAVITLVFGGGGENYTNVQWMLGNLLSGGLFLGAFFMATDYATSPVTLPGQLLYGCGCGLLTIMIRYFGGFPEGVSYAILIMNLCAWAIDKGFRRHQFGVSKEDIKAEKAAKKAAKEAAK